jgi:hypothetical protein
MRKLSIVLSLLVVLLEPAASAGQPDTTASLTPAQVDEVVDHLIAGLSNYVFADVAQRIQGELRAHRGEYRAIDAPAALATRLTADMRAVGHDKHLAVNFGEELGVKKTPTPKEREKAHAYDAANGYGLRSARRLPGNIGYIDLAYFSPDPDAGTQLAAAMQTIGGTDALIIDLRRNGGGSGEAAGALLSYFFEDPVELPSPVERTGGETTMRQHWTMAYVTGPRFLARPIYVLTGIHTHSAAELCAYALKTMHRATIVGEHTSGEATSATGEIDLGYNFTAFIANGQIISPITHTNWLGTGVQPDIVTVPGGELLSAYKTALGSVTPAILSGDLAKERQTALADPQAALMEEVTGFPMP